MVTELNLYISNFIINLNSMFGLKFKNGEQPQPKRVTIPTVDDAYTQATSAKKIIEANKTNTEDFFIDKTGLKTPISKLDGQSDELLKAARKDIKLEEKNDAALRAFGPDLEDSFPPISRN